ncbi:MAG TPA: hypothetical protein DEB39_00370 [Planctomycetaceae bacterium]|nr:hypothetical protein [Planctomycetaceae bacterium]
MTRFSRFRPETYADPACLENETARIIPVLCADVKCSFAPRSRFTSVYLRAGVPVQRRIMDDRRVLTAGSLPSVAACDRLREIPRLPQ